MVTIFITASSIDNHMWTRNMHINNLFVIKHMTTKITIKEIYRPKWWMGNTRYLDTENRPNNLDPYKLSI